MMQTDPYLLKHMLQLVNKTQLHIMLHKEDNPRETIELECCHKKMVLLHII